MTNNQSEDIAAIAAGQKSARECPYHHPVGTRCPNCAKWPYKKGGASAYVAELHRAHLNKTDGEKG